jgi:hypothetical protein
MRWVLFLASLIGFGQAAVAGEAPPPLRGSYDTAQPSYTVLHTSGEPIAHPLASRPPFREPAYRLPLRPFTFEIGGRYWYSSGKVQKTLFDDPRFSEFTNSRLTYSDLKAHAGEVFGRADHVTGVFVKGYFGMASLRSGELEDEDFPPGIDPYSSTISEQRNGDLRYFNVDAGYSFFRGARTQIGAFVGYHQLKEDMHAFGCVQGAGNPLICVPDIPDNVLGISEHTKWQSLRLGLVADMMITQRLKLTAEAAWLPYVHLRAHDIHWLRLGAGLFDIAGPIPERGSGYGYQLEAILSYAVTDRIQLGIGGRYWHMETEGSTQFEHVIVGWPIPPVAQPLDFNTTRYGVFAQGSYRFGS